jgi:hypothetical protein
VAVNTIVGDIYFSAEKPFRPRRIPFRNFVPFLKPIETFRLLRPKTLRIAARAFVNFRIVGVGLFPKFF